MPHAPNGSAQKRWWRRRRRPITTARTGVARSAASTEAALNQLLNELVQTTVFPEPATGWVVQGWLVCAVFQRGDERTTRFARLGTCQAESTTGAEIAEIALPYVRQRSRVR